MHGKNKPQTGKGVEQEVKENRARNSEYSWTTGANLRKKRRLQRENEGLNGKRGEIVRKTRCWKKTERIDWDHLCTKTQANLEELWGMWRD